jgi:hypothetical protein
MISSDNCINRFFQQYVERPILGVIDITKCWIKSEIEFIKEKPLKAVALLAFTIASIALMVFAEIAILPMAVAIPLLITAAALFVTSHGFRSAELVPRGIKFRALHFIDENRLEKVKNKEIAVVLRAEADHNGALNLFHEKTFLNKYPLAMRNVSILEEIPKAIDDAIAQGNKIKKLVFKIHGEPDSMGLSKCDEKIIKKLDQFKAIHKVRPLTPKEREKYLKYREIFLNSSINPLNVSKLEDCLQKLDKDAVIILDSCSTGGISFTGKNIAQRIAAIAHGRKVIAPAKDVNYYGTCIDPDTLDVKFYACDDGIINNIKGFFGGIPYMFNLSKKPYFHKDITQTYQCAAA